MCGIAGFVLRSPDVDINRELLLDELLRGIDSRGGDATGFVARNREGLVEWHKASTDTRGFLPHRRRMPESADVCLAHTRFATNGHQAFPENNHPVKRGPMFVTHNGVVYNDRELFKACDRTPYGQVDSEALAALLSHCGQLTPRAAETFAQVDGWAAIAAMDERDGTVMLARISSSPLHVLTTRRVTIWASTADAAERAHERVIGSLGRARAVAYDEGEGLILRDGRGTRFDFAPPVFYWSKATPTKAAAQQGETTGSYLPSDANNWHKAGTCELCGMELHDAYDLWDDNDVYEVCAPCWDAYADPRDRHLGRITA